MKVDERRRADAEAKLVWPPESDEAAVDYLHALLFGKPEDPEAGPEWDSAADWLNAVADVVLARRGTGWGEVGAPDPRRWDQ